MNKIFGTDGVRGTIGIDISVFDILKLAISGGIFFRKNAITNKILLGKDTRKSGYMVENAIVSGLTSIGFDVIQIGPMPTPAVALLTTNMRCDGGIMISASHNPYQDNGIKFFNKNGNKLSHNQEIEIEKIFFNQEHFLSNYKSANKIGTATRIDDVVGRYIFHIKNSFPKSLTLTDVRVVVDCANGAGYKVAPQIFEELGADVVVLHNSPNGININENCGALHYQDLAKEVLASKADIGIALDGDADRLVVVDENGDRIDGDNLIASIAIYLKSKNALKNNKVVTTVMSNKALKKCLQENGITHEECDVGDKNVTELMHKIDSNFGGEESGHIIFSDFAYTGDGLLSALQTLAILVSSKKKASIALRSFEPYNRILQNMAINKKVPLESIEDYDDLCKNLKEKGIYTLIRYSGTENLLRVLIESSSSMYELKKEMQQIEEFFDKRLS